MNKPEIRKAQELLLGILPHWNYRIARPFKQLLADGMSLEMYYCLYTLIWFDDKLLTVTELANCVQMSKQQVSKIVNRLVEYDFVKRIYDKTDRRIIKLQVTPKASEYIDHYLQNNANCFVSLLNRMSEEDLSDFNKALETLQHIFWNYRYEQE